MREERPKRPPAALSICHFAALSLLFLVSYAAGGDAAHRQYPDPTMLEELTSRAVAILAQPMYSLYMLSNGSLPNIVESLLIPLNSAVWSFGIVLLFDRVHSRRRKPRTSS